MTDYLIISQYLEGRGGFSPCFISGDNMWFSSDADVKHADAQPADDDAEDANAANAAADARTSRRHDAQWLQYGNERNDDARPRTWRHARHAAGPTWNGSHDDARHEAYDGPWPPRDAPGYGQQTPATRVQHEFTGNFPIFVSIYII